MKKFLVLKNGRELEITGEQGKYWLCGDLRFRKLGASAAGVKEIPEDAPAPKKKTAKKKKAEGPDDGERGQ